MMMMVMMMAAIINLWSDLALLNRVHDLWSQALSGTLQETKHLLGVFNDELYP